MNARESKKIVKVAVSILLFLVMAMAMGMLTSCLKENKPQETQYTLTFVTDGGSEIPSITAKEGEAITPPADPEKAGHEFVGWFLQADGSGESVTVPSVMPGQNVTYYAVFIEESPIVKIVYNYNLTGVAHSGEVSPSVAKSGETVQVKTGADYGADGYWFVGWSLDPKGLISFSGTTEEGQYMPGDEVVLSKENLTLYAQWAVGYADSYGERSETLYVYEGRIGKGLGAAILVLNGEVVKLGFVEDRLTTQSGYDEFTFYYDDNEVVGRLYEDGTYAFPDGVCGQYLNYDYITEGYDGHILAMDGFGRATISEMVGNQTSVLFFGVYEYQKDYGDYLFLVLDPVTGMPIADAEGNMQSLYFMLRSEEVQNTQFTGSFLIQGLESGSYLLYDNGELYDYRLDLNGYGMAKLYAYNPISYSTDLVCEGVYSGTENYESEFGEWTFDAPGVQDDFRFILSYISGGSDYTLIYIEYNADWNKTFTDASGNGDTLYLDGYGGARYTTGGTSYEGNCTLGESLVTFVPYVTDGDGNVTAGNKLFFNVDFSTMTFAVNSSGFVVDGTTIISYEGTAEIVVLPDGITAVADNAFNYTRTDVSLISVTIPAGVTSIGKHAFQNAYTLQRVVFLSSTPIDIDWSADGDPFRWGAGNFVIVVPEGSQDAYKAAWSGCKYTIKGSVEITVLPEFEVVDGVLVAYNKQPDSGEALDIVLPDEAVEIAANVFRGLSFIRSVDFNNVVKIGENAFYGCEGLVQAKLTKVQIVGDSAFGGCYNLGSANGGKIELPAIVTVGAGAFASCESLKLVRMGESLQEIGATAFAECHVYVDEDPLFLELLGETPPSMGEKVAIGNISFRIKVQDISMAIECFNAPGWNAYCKHLYIESGAEAGLYMSGSDKLVLDGRAEIFDSEVMLYAVYGTKIVLYWYDTETANYTIINGTIKNGVITLELNGTTYRFVRVQEEQTYTSADGKYTLVCNPLDLLPEKYADNGYVGYADGTLNGVKVQILVQGFNVKKIRNFLDSDNKRYDFTISLENDELVYEKTAAEAYIRNITAADGSVLNLHFVGKSIYVFGTLNIEVDSGVMMPSWSDWGVLATNTEGNVYTFTRKYKETVYTITIVLSDDLTTFTYKYRIG